jgi:hypothetical protein
LYAALGNVIISASFSVRLHTPLSFFFAWLFASWSSSGSNIFLVRQ